MKVNNYHYKSCDLSTCNATSFDMDDVLHVFIGMLFIQALDI